MLAILKVQVNMFLSFACKVESCDAQIYPSSYHLTATQLFHYTLFITFHYFQIVFWFTNSQIPEVSLFAIWN